jgi:prepilin-type N-terminal cleavage/methylation domain-containing protein
MVTRRAVTLIELLVVVTVLSILVAIGVVNLLGAQDRARVTRIRSELRLLANALDAYHVDHNSFPPSGRLESIAEYQRLFVPVVLTPLTTPMAYLTTLMTTDPFAGASGQDPDPYLSYDASLRSSYVYLHYPEFATFKHNPRLWRRAFCVASLGPDRVDSYGVYRPFPSELPAEASYLGIRSVADTVYDPTNGTRSRGDLTRFGGNLDIFPED